MHYMHADDMSLFISAVFQCDGNKVQIMPIVKNANAKMLSRSLRFSLEDGVRRPVLCLNG